MTCSIRSVQCKQKATMKCFQFVIQNCDFIYIDSNSLKNCSQTTVQHLIKKAYYISTASLFLRYCICVCTSPSLLLTVCNAVMANGSCHACDASGLPMSVSHDKRASVRCDDDRTSRPTYARSLAAYARMYVQLMSQGRACVL